MPTHTPLRIEHLEDRSLMSATALGTPWPDAGALSLSFAPDATPIGAQKSNLFKTLDKTASEDDWQREVLRAFQAWAVHSNINIAVTPDGGDAFGAPGDSQGDTRFGDIRVGAAPLAADSLANVSPFDWSIGTWSGDLLLNSASKFGVGSKAKAGTHDLFSVILHEAGHVFGLDHSDGAGSALAARYAGAVLGPSPDDIAALQAAYGPRLPDAFEGVRGNDTLATAAALSGESNFFAVADVGSRTDADYFSFLVPAGTDKFSVRVRTAGLSSLIPAITLYDPAGAVVQTRSGSDPLDPKDLEVKANAKGTAGGRYTVRIAGATGDDFAIGRYEVRANFLKTAEPVVAANFIADRGENDTILTADDLLPGRQTGWRIRGNGFSQNAVIESAADTDFYRLTTPSNGSGTADALTVQVRGLGNKSGGVAPALAVYDASGKALPARVLDSDGPSVTLQVPGIERGATYLVRVKNGTGTAAGNGNYRLTAVVGALAERGMHVVEAGTLDAALRTRSSILNVENGRLFQFALNVTGDANVLVRLSIQVDRGREVFSSTQKANQRPESGQVYLPTGRYRMIVTQTRGTGTARYWLQAGVYSDPIGPYAPRVTSPPTATSPPPPLSSPVFSPFTSDAQYYSDEVGYWYVPFTSRETHGYYYEM